MHTQPIEKLTFTSPIGQFTFAPDTLLIHAQLVRDTVVGQWLDPKPNTPRLKKLDDVYQFIRNHDSAVLAKIQFTLVLNEGMS